MNLTKVESQPEDLAAVPIPLWVPVAYGCALRLLFIGARSLQIDETWTFQTMVVPEGPIAASTYPGAFDSHPLSFYLAYKCLAPLLTLTDWAIRVPTAICSILSIFLWNRALQTLQVHPVIRWWCVAVFALLPLNVFHSQDARAYAIAQFCGVGCVWAYANLQQRFTKFGWAYLAGWTLASCLLDGIGLVIPCGILAHAIGLRVKDTKRDSRVIWAIVTGGLCAGPYYGWRINQWLSRRGFAASLKAVSMFRLLEILVELSPFGVSAQHLPRMIWPTAAITILGLVIAGLLAASVRAPSHWMKSEVKWLFWLLLAPTLVGALLSSWVLGSAPVERRYYCILVPGMIPLLVLGTMVVVARLRLVPYLLFLLVPALVSTVLVVYDADRPEWRGLMAKVVDEFRPSDVFIQPRVSPTPFVASAPLLTYTQLHGQLVSKDHIFEYGANNYHCPQAVLSLDQNDCWKTPDDRVQLRDFLKEHGSVRVWSFKTPLSRDISIDLSPIARVKQRWNARSLEVTLWEIGPQDAVSVSARGNR